MDATDDLDGSLGSAWATVKSFFSETPAKGPCIPCAARKKPVVGPKWEKAAGDVFPGQQSFSNCGLQASRQVVEQAKGKLAKTEAQFMNDAIASCGAGQGATPADSGVTSSVVRQCVMKQYGVASTVQPATLANVDAALRSGKGVIVSADSDTLWATQGIQSSGAGGGHAVLLTNAIYDSTGKMTGVDVNDTGTGSRYALSAEDLDDCLKSGSGKMNVTDAPIWPTN